MSDVDMTSEATEKGQGKRLGLRAGNQAAKKKVVIVGGGFAGLSAAKNLGGQPVEIILIDRQNHHTFQPLLYQVAAGVLTASEIAQPLRTALRGVENLQILMGEVSRIDPAGRSVTLDDGTSIGYDYLVVAAGAGHSYFGHDSWEKDAPGLKTIDDAVDIRRRILLAFEQAERKTWQSGEKQPVNFIVVGGGPTGVELAGVIRDISTLILKQDFHSIDPAACEVRLLEGAGRVLAHYPEDLSEKAAQQLEKLGVIIQTKTTVTEVEEDCLWVGDVRMPSNVTLWAAGVAASPLGKCFAGQTDKSGAVTVNEFLNPAEHPEIFVCGDLAHFEQDGKRVPGIAQPAMQMGKHAARSIAADCQGKPRAAFRYFDKGNMATIGRHLAVADVKWPFEAHLSGYPAWIMWLVIHLLFLAGFRNRASVFMSWAMTYFGRSQGAGLIAK